MKQTRWPRIRFGSDNFGAKKKNYKKCRKNEGWSSFIFCVTLNKSKFAWKFESPIAMPHNFVTIKRYAFSAAFFTLLSTLLF